MEILQSLYQQRLNSLANSFFHLLQQLQKTVSPFSQPELANHRIDYLKHIVTLTLENDREKFIKQLFEEIEDLRGKLSMQASSLCEPMICSKEFSGNSTCSRESEDIGEAIDMKFYSNGFSSSKKSRDRLPSKFEETYNEDSICLSTITSGLKKKSENSRSQTSINFQSIKKKINFAEKEEPFQFKYLRIGKY